MFPQNAGIDCFARGETIEFGFVRDFSKYIKMKASEKKNVDDPDAIFTYEEQNGLILPTNRDCLFDVKTSKNGFTPQKRNKNKFLAKRWDFKKTQKGVDKFMTRAEWYLLIDPWNARLAAMESTILQTKKITQNSSRISFSVHTDDVIMIYDGIDDQEDVYVEVDKDAFCRTTWDSL